MLSLQPPFILKKEWPRAGAGGAFLERSDMLVVLRNAGMLVTDVSVIHPAANSLVQWAAHQLALQLLLGTHRLQGAGGQVADGSFFPLSMESYGRLGRPALQFLQGLASAAAFSATAGSDVTTSSFIAGRFVNFASPWSRRVTWYPAKLKAECTKTSSDKMCMQLLAERLHVLLPRRLR
jgi:hypothetical protein